MLEAVSGQVLSGPAAGEGGVQGSEAECSPVGGTKKRAKQSRQRQREQRRRMNGLTRRELREGGHRVSRRAKQDKRGTAAAGVVVNGPASPSVQLRFCCWNVNGLTTVRKASVIAEQLLRGNQYDVVGLTETHLSQADEWCMDPSLADAYDMIQCSREGEERRVEGRGSGGLLLAVRKAAGLKVSRKQTTEYGDRLWVQLKQGSHTWYVGLVYMPCGTKRSDEILELYQKEMDELQREVLLLRQDAGAEVLVMGDFNAGIGTASSYTIGEHGNGCAPGVQTGVATQCEWGRMSEDTAPADKAGKCLLHMVEACQLVIMNGLRRVEREQRGVGQQSGPTDRNGATATLRRWQTRPVKASVQLDQVHFPLNPRERLIQNRMTVLSRITKTYPSPGH